MAPGPLSDTEKTGKQPGDANIEKDEGRKRIFLSYKRSAVPDQPLVEKVYEILKQHHDVFIDRKMDLGLEWASKIEKEICNAHFFIVFISKNTIKDSEMVVEEIETAHREYKKKISPKIIPVRVQYTDPFPRPISSYLNRFNWGTWDEEADTIPLCEKVIKAVSEGEMGVPTSVISSKPVKPDVLPTPYPFAQIEVPGGAIDSHSRLYIERQEDKKLEDIIPLQGITATIKGPRQMGKSSLLYRAMDLVSQKGKKCVFLDFQLLAPSTYNEYGDFLSAFCSMLTDEMDMEDRVAQHWDNPLPPSQRCTRYLTKYLFAKLEAPVFLAMDEVDSMLQTRFYTEFFGMLRAWHNSRKRSPVWKDVDLCLVISTEPQELIADLSQSPFNVGEIISLNDFTPEQVADVNNRHGNILNPDELKEFFSLTAGQPFLVRKGLYHIAAGQITFKGLLEKACDEDGPFHDHLRHHLYRLNKNEGLIKAMHLVLKQNECSEDSYARLNAAGLVKRKDDSVIARCKLYADFFGKRLNG